MKNTLYNNLVHNIGKALNETMFNDEIFQDDEKSILNELNVSDNLGMTSQKLSQVDADWGYIENNGGKYDYIIVYPIGFVELLTKFGLNAKLKELKNIVDSGDDFGGEAEEEMYMYEEVRDMLKTPGIWYNISGPGDFNKDNVLRGPIAMKFDK